MQNTPKTSNMHFRHRNVQTGGTLCMNDTNYRTKPPKIIYKNICKQITAYVKIRPSLDGVRKGLVLCQVFIAICVRFTLSCEIHLLYLSWLVIVTEMGSHGNPTVLCCHQKRNRGKILQCDNCLWGDILSHQIALPFLPAVYLEQEVDGNLSHRIENEKTKPNRSQPFRTFTKNEKTMALASFTWNLPHFRISLSPGRDNNRITWLTIGSHD